MMDILNFKTGYYWPTVLGQAQLICCFSDPFKGTEKDKSNNKMKRKERKNRQKLSRKCKYLKRKLSLIYFYTHSTSFNCQLISGRIPTDTTY